jgi:adenylate cyclase
MSDSSKAGFLQELKQRNVVRVAIMYAVSAFVVLQLADVTFPVFDLPNWSYRLVIWLLGLGFPLALVLAWIFDITPDGVVRTSEASDRELQQLRRSRKFYVVAIILLLTALGLMFLQPSEPPSNRDGYAEIRRSIAVLPFANMSADPENLFFADGIAEEVLNVLAKIPDLQVAARTSSFRYRDESVDPRQIGEELQVAHVLEGSVRRSADSVRVTVQLIRTDTGYHLWSETYEAPRTDVFRIQDQIASNVAQALKSTLYQEVLREAARGRTDNMEAYELYLRAKDKRGGGDWALAVQYARQAIALDPQFVNAYAILAMAYSTRIGGTIPAEEAFAQVRLAVDAAMAIDPNVPDVLIALARLERAAHNYTGAEMVYRQVKALVPHRMTVDLGNLLVALGRMDEAIVEYRYSREVDPVNAAGPYLRGLLAAGQTDQALSEVESMFAISSLVSDLPLFLADAMIVYAIAGEHKKAIELADQLGATLARTSPLIKGYVAWTYARSGDREQALVIVRELEARAITGYVSPASMFWAHLGLANVDLAFKWLEQAIEENSFLVIMGLKTYPQFDPLRSDPRFQSMLQKAGLES